MGVGRSALFRDKEKVLSSDHGTMTEVTSSLTPEEAIRDPHVLDFLDLKDAYSESDLEAAQIERLTDFLLVCTKQPGPMCKS